MLFMIDKRQYLVHHFYQFFKLKRKFNKNTFLKIKMSVKDGNKEGNATLNAYRGAIEYLTSPTKSQNDKKEYR